MLSWQPKYHELSEDAKQRLDAFYLRFCQGRLGQHYGLGHLLFACHAAFPLVLSPELANLIWINFKNYYSRETHETLQIHPVAVSDFLASPLCHKLGIHRYEVFPEIRSYLLMLLSEGEWFETSGIKSEGKERLTELAYFLRQYLIKKVPEGKYDGAAFRQLNNWAVMAWLKPGQLATNIARAFDDNSKISNEKAQLWLSRQMEKVELQYQRKVNSSDDARDLKPFYQLFYYAKARSEELNEKRSNASEYAQEIPRFMDTGVLTNEIVVRLPLTRSIVERTERKIKEVQRILALFLGNDETLENNFTARNPVAATIANLRKTMSAAIANQKIEFEEITVLTDDATSAPALPAAIADLYNKANDEDIVLLFFSGTAYLNDTNQVVWFPQVENPPSHIALDRFQYNEIVKKSGKKCQSVIILDTSTGYYDWGSEADVFIGGTRNTYQRRSFEFGGLSDFLHAFIDLLSLGHHYTYQDLFLCLKAKMMDGASPQTEQAPAFRATKRNFLSQFLTRQLVPAALYPLLIYNKQLNCWKMIDEDFKLLTLNGGSEVFDFEMKNQIPDVRGEIFINRRDNIIQFGGIVTSLHQQEIYRVKSRRHELQYDIIAESTLTARGAEDDISTLLQQGQFDDFCKWGSLIRARDHETGKEAFLKKISGLAYYSILLVEIIEDNGTHYRLSRYEKSSQTPAATPLIANINGKENIVIAISKLLRYEYLLGLERPESNYVLFDPLDVSYYWYWVPKNGASSNNYPAHTLLFTEDAFEINGGLITINPFGVNITNRENFDIFYEVYLMLSDLTIKKLSGGGINQIGAGKIATVSANEPVLLEKMLTQNLEINIKVLVSRDPIQVEFAQII